MSVSPPTDSELREAVRPLRPDPDEFSRGVHERLCEAESVGPTPESVSPLVRLAASVLPLPLLGGKALVSGVKTGSLGTGYKLLGYLALPAVSVFLMLGAFVFSALRIGSTRATATGSETQDAVNAWWRRYWWVATPFYVGLLANMVWGSGTLTFGLLLTSFVVLSVLLSALSRAGLASRGAIAHVCCFGLLYMAMSMGVARSHAGGLLDGALGAGVLYAGCLLVVVVGGPWRLMMARLTV